MHCRSGIADLNKFTNAPVLLLYGFMCVACTAAIWDNFATYLSLPVSTTHTTGARALAHDTITWLGPPCLVKAFGSVAWGQLAAYMHGCLFAGLLPAGWSTSTTNDCCLCGV